MSALARAEQKLGYMGDVDDVRWQLYKCISLDMGAGVVLGGFGCEEGTAAGEGTTPSGKYKELQEIFSGTTCEQNSAWEAYTERVQGKGSKAGSVSCSSLASSYCNASDKTKAGANMSAYYNCQKDGVAVSCVELAEQYCTVTGEGTSSGSEEGDSESTTITDEEKKAQEATATQAEAESKAEKAISSSNTQKCIVNGVEVKCSSLAEANEIRKRIKRDSNFDGDSTECYADVVCKNATGGIVACENARNMIQCGKSSEEGLSVGYSCYVGGEEIDCNLLGEGNCTEATCKEMCPDYGGKVSKDTCACNAEPICSGAQQTGTNLCPLGGKPKANGTQECFCFSEASCMGSDQYYYDDGDKIVLKAGDAGYCAYGGVCAGQENNALYECATELCPYGSNFIKNGKQVFDPNYCPYGADETEEPVVNQNCTLASICPYGGTNQEDGSCSCYSKPICSGVTDSQNGTNKCLYGGIASANGTRACSCNDAPDCNIASTCAYGGVAKGDGANACVCNDVPQCTECKNNAGTPKGDGTQDCSCTSGENCANPKVCAYGGTNRSNGSCSCNEAPVCNGTSQTGTNNCVYGGSPSADGTFGCACNEAPACSTICASAGGTALGKGTSDCQCTDGATHIITVGSYSHASGTVTTLQFGYMEGYYGTLTRITGVESIKAIGTFMPSNDPAFSSVGTDATPTGVQSATTGLNVTVKRLDTGASITTTCDGPNTICGQVFGTLFSVSDIGKEIRLQIIP